MTRVVSERFQASTLIVEVGFFFRFRVFLIRALRFSSRSTLGLLLRLDDLLRGQRVLLHRLSLAQLALEESAKLNACELYRFPFFNGLGIYQSYYDTENVKEYYKTCPEIKIIGDKSFNKCC